MPVDRAGKLDEPRGVLLTCLLHVCSIIVNTRLIIIILIIIIIAFPAQIPHLLESPSKSQKIPLTEWYMQSATKIDENGL